MPAKSSPADEQRQLAHLHDILESAQHVLRYVEGVSSNAFADNPEKRDAVAMRLAVIGEAARHVSDTTAAKLPNVPFVQLRGMRNRIAHDYGQVDPQIVWTVVSQDIAPLADAVAAYLAPIPPLPEDAL